MLMACSEKNINNLNFFLKNLGGVEKEINMSVRKGNNKEKNRE